MHYSLVQCSSGLGVAENSYIESEVYRYCGQVMKAFDCRPIGPSLNSTGCFTGKLSLLPLGDEPLDKRAWR